MLRFLAGLLSAPGVELCCWSFAAGSGSALLVAWLVERWQAQKMRHRTAETRRAETRRLQEIDSAAGAREYLDTWRHRR